jgi:NADH-quinone oxidoreductase subunit L
MIPALPLFAAALIAFLGPRFLRGHSHWPCIAAIAAACVLSVIVITKVGGLPTTGDVEPDRFEQTRVVETYYQWAKVGAVDLGFTLRADGLSAIMLVTVTFVGTLIAIFAAGYMHDDPGYPRFFAAVSLFIAAMTLLVLANNFLVLYAGWEGVGLCSYLLIGFWFQKPEAVAAARKAFLVTRLGDMGMLLGIILLWVQSGYKLDYDSVFAALQGNPDVWLICLLLFCGAVGKSAQFPLHVWLPDAMEGPTPVSALIHAATMVTAGVYLVARCSPLFFQSPNVQFFVACIGGITALLGALIALTQNDLKRVLAYSTISQLGYMFLALGSGVFRVEPALGTMGVTAAIFHLFTHAFFKALLFLSAGSVMHAMGGIIDMRRFSGLKTVMPWTRWTFLCGAVALAGLPPFSGFWSKDEILGTTLRASEGGDYANSYFVLYVAGLITAGLTAFYTTRAYILTFEGPTKIPHEAGHHAHESPRIMIFPLVILAVGAVALGLIEPLTHAFSGMLTRHTLGLTELHHQKLEWGVMAVSSLFALGGVGAAWWVYGLRQGLADAFARRMPVLYQLSLNKFGFDEIYHALIVRPLDAVAATCRAVDAYLVDGLVDLVGSLPRSLGNIFRPVQNGLVQFYALAMLLGLTVFLIALLSKL